MNLPTPHIKAKKGDFAKTVLMPGDPLRAKYIAEKYLDNAILVTDVRGMLGYTGLYKGVRVSVMASGMGCPSMGIYSYELYNGYDVDNIIRIGSCGALTNNLKLMDIIVAIGACYDAGFVNQFELSGHFSAVCDYSLLDTCMKTANEHNISTKVGSVYTSDSFYGERRESINKWIDMGVLACEMETAGLYMNMAQCGKKALSLLTVSDFIFGKDGGLSSDEREKSLNDMIILALETAIKL